MSFLYVGKDLLRGLWHGYECHIFCAVWMNTKKGRKKKAGMRTDTDYGISSEMLIEAILQQPFIR